jgi:hypothetical protein
MWDWAHEEPHRSISDSRNAGIPKSHSACYRPRLVSPRIVGSLNVATTPA